MASRFYNPPNRSAQPDDIHPSWCTCSDCAYDYDLARRRCSRPLLIGLLIAVIAAGAIAAAFGGGAA